MPIKLAINGYGRIGRNILRAIFESGRSDEFEIVAVNDLGDANTNAHLTTYDTAHGRFPGDVRVDGDHLVVNGQRILVCAERDPAKLPWKKLGVDVVHESTGLFTSKGIVTFGGAANDCCSPRALIPLSTACATCSCSASEGECAPHRSPVISFPSGPRYVTGIDSGPAIAATAELTSMANTIATTADRACFMEVPLPELWVCMCLPGLG